MHFEIPVDDLERARKFYRSVFGWKTRSMPDMDYTMVQTTEVGKDRMPVERGAINGGMMKRGRVVSAPVITVEVDDIGAAISKAERQGGKLALGKQTVGDMGFSAYVKDSEGNLIGLWQSTGD